MGHSESGEIFDPDLPFFEQMDPTAFDPVIEAFKRDIDFTLVERNLRLTRDERAQQLVNATRFIGKFRPVVSETNDPKKPK